MTPLPPRLATTKGPLRRWLPLLGLVWLGVGTLGPGAGCSPAAPAKPALVGHPGAEWKGDDKELFADSVDLGAFPPPGTNPGRDEENEAKIIPRVNRADGVLIARFVSVSSEPTAGKERYRLELVPEGDPLSGKHPPGSPFVLVVDPQAPAFGTIRAQGDKLIGQKAVVYYRRFGDDEDTVRNRFHLSALTPALVKFIGDYVTKKQFH